MDGIFHCTYDECLRSDECAGGPCDCGGDVLGNVCLAGNCKVDADCGDGGWCSRSMDECAYGILSYYCRTHQDTCVTDADCEASDRGDLCYFEPTLGHWTCTYTDGCMSIG